MLPVIFNLLSYLISCGTGSFIVFDFCNKMYAKKKTDFFYIIAELIFGLIWFTISNLNIPLMNLFFLLISSCLVALLFYSGSAFWKIMQMTILSLSYVSLDVIIATALSNITKSPIPLYSKSPVLLLINVIMVQLIMLITYKGLILLLRKNKGQDSVILKKQYALFTLFPALNILVLYMLSILAADKSDNYLMLLMALLLAILNFLILYFFDYVAKSEELRRENELMQERMDSQYNYYRQLEEMNEQSQKIMHDIKNHLQIIQALNNGEANKYADKISSIVDNTALKFKSHNKLLNIIINLKMKECENNQITFNYTVEDTDLSFINDIDITAIFANLLDNAIEACNRISYGDKTIELRVYRHNDMLVITLINTFNAVALNDNGEYLSSKKGHKALGLSNVKQAVSNYNGDFNIQVEGNHFVSSIIFPV